MAGEDIVLTLTSGIPTRVTIEDNLHTYTAGETVAVGDVVHQRTTADTSVRLAKADDSGRVPPVGIVCQIDGADHKVVATGGVATGLTGLSRGVAYWLSTTGTTGNTLTSTQPSTNAYLIGVALSATSLLMCCVSADLASSALEIVKEPVRLATTADHGLSGLAAIDGVTPIANDRILVKNQTTGSENGLYLAAAGAWSRTADGVAASTTQFFAGVSVRVTEGTLSSGQSYFITTTGTLTIGTTAHTWAITIINADDMNLVSSELEAAGTNSQQLSIKAAGVTEAKLGFSWETVEVAASAFGFSATRSTYTLASAASSNGNVIDNAELLENGVGGLVRVTTTAATDEWSLSGTTLSVHGDITATGSTFQLRYVIGTASGAASASGNQIWLGTLPQVPLQTESDYFQGGELDSKWSEWDVAGTSTFVVGSDGLVITQTTSAGDTTAGIYQAAPSDDQFCITARVSHRGQTANFGPLNIFIGEDVGASPSTASIYDISLSATTSGFRHDVASYTAYNTLGTVTISTDYGISNISYLRIYVDRTLGTNGHAQALTSTDGRTWVALSATVDMNGVGVSSIDTIGIALNNIATGVDLVGLYDMFRVDITSDPRLPVGGYVGTSVPSTVLDGPRDVVPSGGNTVRQYGWPDRKVKLIKVEAFSVTVATVGAYTLALAKGASGFATNLLATATFDLTTSGTLSAFVPTNVPLTATDGDLIFDADEVWRAEFVSDNAGLDAAGVYFVLTWLVL